MNSITKMTVIFLPLLFFSILSMQFTVPQKYNLRTLNPTATQLRASSSAVRLQLKWLHQAQFAGFYLANDLGIYTREGFTVQLLPYDMSQNPIDIVLAGKAEYGIVGAEELLSARAQGKKVKAIAAIFQRAPVVFMTLKTSNITSPKQFRNRRIEEVSGTNVEMILRALLNSVNINRDTETIKTPSVLGNTDLFNKTTDVSGGYIISELYTDDPSILGSIHTIHPEDYGLRAYGDVLFTTEDMIQRKPEEVRKFVHASIDGWGQAMLYPNKAAASTVAMMQTTDAGALIHQSKLIKQIIPYLKNDIHGHIGDMTTSGWQQTMELVRKSGAEWGVNLNDVFDHRFLPSRSATHEEGE